MNDRETLLMLAKMSADAYTRSGQKDWYDLGPDWNNVRPINNFIVNPYLRPMRSYPELPLWLGAGFRRVQRAYLCD